MRAAAGSAANTVDLRGRVVLPGFIEPHMHFALLADLVFLDEDPRRIEPDAISDIGISETWMDGQRVFTA